MITKAYEDGYSKEITLHISDGLVKKRYNYAKEDLCREYMCIDLRDKGLLLPGFIDMHVHLRGLKLSYKEDEESGTKAAVRGGFTAVVDMPNTVPRIDGISSLSEKLFMLKTKSFIDYGIYISPSDDEKSLKELLLVEGVVGVKIFPSDLRLIPVVTNTIKTLAWKRLIIVHAENPRMVNDCEAGFRWRCRPIESEISVLNILKEYADTDIRIHITHVTNALTLTISKKYGFTVDTCPHYLYLDSSHEKEKGCIAKVNPPLRTSSTKDILVSMLKLFDAISSDHAPHSLEEKCWDYMVCPSGIASIEVMASLILNLVSKGILTIDDVAKLLSKGPARILGMRKWGCTYEGCIASYTIVDMGRQLRVDPEQFYSKAKFSPYTGMILSGLVRATVVRGYVVHLDGDIIERLRPNPITRFIG